MSKDKTMMLVALGLGAFLLMRQTASGQTVGTAAQRYFARTNLSPAINRNPAQFQVSQAPVYGAIGQLFGKLIGSATSQPASPFQPIASYAPAAEAAFDPNVYAQAGANIGDPYNVYGADAVALNPAPQFGSAFDYIAGQ